MRRSYHPLTKMRRLLIPVAAFLAGSILMAGVYLGFLALWQGWRFAIGRFEQDARYILPIILAFGAQSSLFSILQFRLFVPVASAASGRVTLGTSGAMSATTMVACCLHHVTSVLPVLGLTAATMFLTRYQRPFLQGSLVVNLLGILVMLAILYRERRKLQLVWETP